MFRIATWNLDRPAIRRKTRAQERLEELLRHDADVWILTETDRDLQLPGYTMVATTPATDPGYHEREAYAAIYARQPLKQVSFDTFESSFAVCAEVDSPTGPLIIYGSIITYRNDGVPSEAKPWVRHRESVRNHGRDWLELRRRYPTHGLLVGGDFNQALDGVGRYRDKESTDLLKAAFSGAGLRCLTDEDFVATEKLRSRHSVDHIAISEGALSNATCVIDAWEATTSAGVLLSDHNGVAVTLDFRRE